MYSIYIRSFAAEILEILQIPVRSIRRKANNQYLVLSYHRIIPKEYPCETVEEGMYVTPDNFEQQMIILKNNFELVHFSDILNKSNHDNEIPKCIVTFDDGWKDVYQYAYPILKYHRIPATIFVPTDYIGTYKKLWTDILINILIKSENAISTIKKEGKINIQIEKLSKNKRKRVREIENIIEELKTRKESELQNLVNILNNNIVDDNYKMTDTREFLNWDEIKEMGQSGLITIGSHTAEHRILTNESEKDIWEELINSRDTLIENDLIKDNFIPFCYPNGNYNENISQLVKSAGYSLAVTTRKGWNSYSDNMFTLKRISIHQDMSSTKAMYKNRITGIL